MRRNNNNSLVMRIRYGTQVFLLTGDIERTSEEAILAAGLDLKATILKVAHHGSKTSTSGLWLEAVKPAVSLISVGYDNLYGHPHFEVVERLRQAHIATLRTDQFGLISVKSDGRRLEMDTNAWHPGEWAWSQLFRVE
jgi:competence protein ComEC